MHQTKTLNYQKILIEIAEERGLVELAEHVKKFSFEKPILNVSSPKYNITHIPEARCEGCE